MRTENNLPWSLYAFLIPEAMDPETPIYDQLMREFRQRRFNEAVQRFNYTYKSFADTVERVSTAVSDSVMIFQERQGRT